MAFKLPSLAQSRELLVAVGRALFPDRAWGSRRTYYGRKATYFSTATTQLHSHVLSAQDECMPDTAPDGAPINRWGKIVGVDRKGATPARKSSAGRVRGSLAAVAPVDSELTHAATGLRFKLASQAVIPAASPNNFFDADIVGIDVGAITRLEAGQTLAFTQPIAGIEPTVVLVKALDEDGFDPEQFGAYRGRILDTWGKPASGGNDADYEKWAKLVTGVATAYTYGNRGGIGSVHVAAFHAATGTARALLTAERNDVLASIRAFAPNYIAAQGSTLRVLVTVADPQPVEILITPNGDPAFAFDWDDTTPPTVLAWNGSTRELQFSGGALPVTLKAGHRISLRGVASTQDSAQLVIQAISAVDKVILQASPINAPAATDVIYSGGPLVDPIRSSIVAHLSGEDVYAARNRTPAPASSLSSVVGLEILAPGIGPANPGGKYGTWTGGIIRRQLDQIAMYKAGVRNTNVVTPATDYEALDDQFPNLDQVHYVVPSSVLVRRG